MARDGAQTAERILQVAHQLFMERGFNGVSIKDVVQQVGISKPTLYYHYANKEALYVAMAHQVLTQMGAELSAAIAEIDGSFAQLLCGVIEMIQSRNAEDTRMLRHDTYLSVTSMASPISRTVLSHHDGPTSSRDGARIGEQADCRWHCCRACHDVFVFCGSI